MMETSIATIEVGENSNPVKLMNKPKQVAQFEKVSYEQFKKDLLSLMGEIFKEEQIQSLYNNIELPKRSTSGSAGYDFVTPLSFIAKATGGVVIPTGIRCKIDHGWVLKLYPRSGQGFKYGMHLYNTVGIIDSDYYTAENEGHILVKISVKEETGDVIKVGSKFCQGIFEQYGITYDDDADGIRTGGFGSTGN